MAVLKFFDVVLKFELPTARFLNFPKNSAAVLIQLVLIIGDYMYPLIDYLRADWIYGQTVAQSRKPKSIKSCT